MRRRHVTGSKKEKRFRAREQAKLDALGAEITRQLLAKSLAELLNELRRDSKIA